MVADIRPVIELKCIRSHKNSKHTPRILLSNW